MTIFLFELSSCTDSALGTLNSTTNICIQRGTVRRSEGANETQPALDIHPVQWSVGRHAPQWKHFFFSSTGKQTNIEIDCDLSSKNKHLLQEEKEIKVETSCLRLGVMEYSIMPVSSRPAWATTQVQGQPELHS